jgi:N-acetylmuramic acid 6-phosphate (MurNAc-6-P) etherase
VGGVTSAINVGVSAENTEANDVVVVVAAAVTAPFVVDAAPTKLKLLYD